MSKLSKGIAMWGFLFFCLFVFALPSHLLSSMSLSVFFPKMFLLFVYACDMVVLCRVDGHRVLSVSGFGSFNRGQAGSGYQLWDDVFRWAVSSCSLLSPVVCCCISGSSCLHAARLCPMCYRWRTLYTPRCSYLWSEEAQVVGSQLCGLFCCLFVSTEYCKFSEGRLQVSTKVSAFKVPVHCLVFPLSDAQAGFFAVWLLDVSPTFCWLPSFIYLSPEYAWGAAWGELDFPCVVPCYFSPLRWSHQRLCCHTCCLLFLISACFRSLRYVCWQWKEWT